MTAPLLWAAQGLHVGWRVALFAALVAAGFWASAVWSAATGIVDDGRIVIDEVAGAALLLFVLRPARVWAAALLLVAFVTIDRVKPWPVSRIEALPGPTGVMLDDLAAAALVIAAVLAGRALPWRPG